MPLELKYDSSGKLVRRWYGRYVDADGRRKLVPLGIMIQGETTGINDVSDPAFVVSKTEAENALKSRIQEAYKGRVDRKSALVMYRERTGVRLKVTAVGDLLALPSTSARKRSKGWTAWKTKILSDFIAWAAAKGIRTVLEVTKDHAQEFLNGSYTRIDEKTGKTEVLRAASTVRRMKSILGEVFDRALPEGAPNPFRAKDVRADALEGDKEYHRIPLSQEKVAILLTVAQGDPLAYDLIVCALSTGLRRGDVCCLKWENVDLAENVLCLKTQKTKKELYLPILPLLRTVLRNRNASKEKGAVYVFPEAEAMMRQNPHGVTWLIKKVFAKAFAEPKKNKKTGAIAKPGQKPKPPAKILAEHLPEYRKSVGEAPMKESKRAKMLDILDRYASGQSYRDIETVTGTSRGAISDFIAEAEKLAAIPIRPDKERTTYTMRKAVEDVTRQARETGNRKASIYDFHSLRTSFVTLALSAGIGVDILKALTGHATVEIVMRHYFKPKGSDFADQLAKAMPKVLTALSKEDKALAAAKPVRATPKKVATLLTAIRKLSDEDRDLLLGLV